ncbi:MAG: GTP-binding protein [Thermoplasmata archaeon]
MQPARGLDQFSDIGGASEGIQEHIKVVLVGPYRSGKSSLIRALTRNSVSVERLGSSVSLDFGQVVVDSHAVNIFGVPGKKAFSFMRSILARGCDVCLLVVDSTDTERLGEARELYEKFCEKDHPVVIVASKQDAEGALKPSVLGQLLDLEDELVVGVSAKTREGMDLLLQTIIEVIRERREHEPD